jgi:starch-binding outer membrane protein, SusD/RagB family
MKILKKHSALLAITVLAGSIIFQTSCRKDLLDQDPTTEVSASEYWKTENDATFALMGLYASIRPCFDRDYYFDGQGEYTRTRNNSASTTSGNLRLGDAYNNANYTPSGYGGSFDKMFRYLYGAVNRANYVIENTTNLLPQFSDATTKKNLQTIIGEARLLRGLAYFKLISMWGDVPFLSHTLSSDADEANAEATGLSRMPIGQVKDSILSDLTIAYNLLPAKAPVLGRASQAAALALRGKVLLYWGSWKKNGWPELEGFTKDDASATAAFTLAAADFKSVINDYGLTLFRGGEPGAIDGLGEADTLPNYYHLFTPKANGDAEMIFVFTHGGTGSSQGEELMRDFAGRSQEASQCWVSPRFEIADRYQLTTTGDFAPKLVGLNPEKVADARTRTNAALNPASYANRDYRMKSTMLWEYELIMSMSSLQPTGLVPLVFKTWGSKVTVNGIDYAASYNTDGTNTGYVFRKFIRNYAGQGRSDGDFAWPVIRLADVYLMYAEATNEVSGPLPDAIDLVNKVRHRGNLPALDASKTADYTNFFSAIEQERIVELIGEGQRSFDIRRWRAIERIWGAPGSAGIMTKDTWGADVTRYYQNTSAREYGQNYIFRIPPAERDRNPLLTQNIPWR